GVGVAGDVGGAPVEAGPRRGHGVGVDVVEQVVDGQVGHAQLQLAAQLTADQLRGLGEEQHPLAGGERDFRLRLHDLPAAYIMIVSSLSPVIVLDFDGTVTEKDIGDEVCDRFAPPEWCDIDAAWIRNEISLPDAQRKMWALARAERADALSYARSIGHVRRG